MAAVGADPIEDVQLPESEVGILRPEMRHDASLRVIRASSVSILELGKRLQDEPCGF
jgi:hypothetical protein